MAICTYWRAPPPSAEVYDRAGFEAVQPNGREAVYPARSSWSLTRSWPPASSARATTLSPG